MIVMIMMILIIRAEGMTDTSFLIANAQIVGFPIVYVSDHFSRLVGHRYFSFDDILSCTFTKSIVYIFKPRKTSGNEYYQYYLT